jgi:hypothetical protein
MKPLHIAAALALMLVACKPTVSGTPDRSKYEARIKELENEVAQLKAAAAKVPPPQPENPAVGKYKGVVLINMGQTRDPFDITLELRPNGNYYMTYQSRFSQPRTNGGKYEIDGDRLRLGQDEVYAIWTIRGNQLLTSDGGRIEKILGDVKDRSKAAKCLSNAKQIGTGCKLYAMDHKGAFPNDLNELVPDYLPDRGVFSSPLAPTPGKLDYEYFGAGGKDTDPSGKILLRGKYTTEDGERSVVRFDISGTVGRQ